MNNPFDAAPETQRDLTPKAEKQFSKAEVESLREKRDAIQKKIEQLQGQLFRSNNELSVAIQNQEKERMMDFAEPLAIPEDWKVTKKIDLDALSEGRPEQFYEMLQSRRREDQHSGFHRQILEDYQNLAEGKFSERSSLMEEKLEDIVKEHYPGWTSDDFKALLKGIEGKEDVESTRSFDELISIVEKKIAEINQRDRYYYSGSGAEYHIQDLLKELLNAQDPKIVSIDLNDEDAVEEAVRGNVRADEDAGKMYFMDEAIFDYENGDSGRASHFDRNALARGLDAFVKRFVPFLKRESEKRKKKAE